MAWRIANVVSQWRNNNQRYRIKAAMKMAYYVKSNIIINGINQWL